MKGTTMRGLIPVVLMMMAAATAQAEPFRTGPVFSDFGKSAPVESDLPIPRGTVFKVAFDVAKGADAGEINRTFDSAGRFINMHVAAGVPLENIHLAIIVHGTAGWDVTNDTVYRAQNGDKPNGSAAVVAALLERGVAVYLCGQSAARMGVTKADLLPGVKLSLSAMTAHALLQQQGYTLNPF
jgi:intracellular sulfur oxidation DsrE/DsrF family protein